MNHILRIFGVLFTFMIGATALQWLKTAYDNADLKKASTFLHEFQPADSSKTVIELMAQSYGVQKDEVLCEGHILSRYEGRIEVRCLPRESALSLHQKEFVFEVEIVGFQTFGRNSDTAAILKGQLP